MRRITLQMYITIDGFADFPDYPGSGDTPIGEEEQVGKEMWINNMESTDTILLGRKTYELWADFWPASKRKPTEHPFLHEMSRFIEKAQKAVFSNTLKKVSWENSRIMSGDVGAAVAQLKREQGKNMALAGGTGLAQEFMRRGLIDDYFFAVFPVILGKGHKLFGELETQQTLKLVDVKHFKYGELVLHYQTVRSPDSRGSMT